MTSTNQRAGAMTSQLTGWGRNLRADCDYVVVETVPDARRFIDPKGTTPRGLGASYGDPALNSGGRVVGLSKLDRYLAFDEATGTLSCEAGLSLAQIIHDFAPRGFFPMITPGTKHVTVGGCIANDVHGKAHHAQGTFSECVESMTVLLASGEVVTTNRSELPDLFWACFGGMGLLGMVLTATIRLRKIETTFFHQKAVVVRDLESMLAAFEQYDKQYPYSVAYVDPIATGARLGCGVLTIGDHAARADLPSHLAANPLRVSRDAKLQVPFELPELTLNPLTIRALNVVLKQIQGRAGAFAHYEKFFYPLDAIRDWNRGYGKRGFTQYQFVIPLQDGYLHMRRILETIVSSGQLPFLNVLKKFGPEGKGVLSFPFEGYTFAIDFPIRSHTAELLHRLDAMVVEAGGRIYLGKDAFVDAPTFRAMYPRLDGWLATKAKYDPHNVFVSDLGRRVGLIPKD